MFRSGFRVSTILTLLCFSWSANACLVKEQPLDLESYPQIFIGKVTGVKLDEYESRVLKKKSESWSDLTQRHTIRVVSETWIKGKGGRKIHEFSAGGCAVLVPDLLDEGIFFVSKDGRGVIPIYSKEGLIYAKWLYKVEYLKKIYSE